MPRLLQIAFVFLNAIHDAISVNESEAHPGKIRNSKMPENLRFFTTYCLTHISVIFHICFTVSELWKGKKTHFLNDYRKNKWECFIVFIFIFFPILTIFGKRRVQIESSTKLNHDCQSLIGIKFEILLYDCFPSNELFSIISCVLCVRAGHILVV